MLTKKIKLIIFGSVGLLILIGLSFVLVTSYNDKNNKNININLDNNVNVENNNSVDKEEVVETNDNATTTVQSEVVPDPVIDRKAEEARQAKYLVKLKDSHPEYSATQLEFYSATAAKKEMLPCLGKDDESSCISAVAFITRSNNFCGEVKEAKNQFECSDVILNEEAEVKIQNCQLETSQSSQARCLINIFGIYKQPENCNNLILENLKKECVSAAYYQMAIEKQEEKLCDNITNESIKNYCLEGLVTESQDSDSDGLSNYDEVNIYKTNPDKTDTDGDGYSDGDEVKSGHNPNGI